MANNHEFTEMGDEELGLSDPDLDTAKEFEQMYPASVIEEALDNMQIDLRVRSSALTAAVEVYIEDETPAAVIAVAREFEKYLREG